MRSPLLSVLVAALAGCGGGKGGGADGGGGASDAVNCYPLTNDAGTNCGCASVKPADRNLLSECSADSVASTDHGYCCNTSGFCTCYQTACVDVRSIGHCECGYPYDTTSPRVDSCPALGPGAVCCLDPNLHPAVCWCNDNMTSCPVGRVVVASCALADVMTCGAGETVVARCK